MECKTNVPLIIKTLSKLRIKSSSTNAGHKNLHPCIYITVFHGKKKIYIILFNGEH